MFSTGPNVEFGGPNNTACHIDIPMRGCSVVIDGVTIVENEQVLTDRSLGTGGER
jgi:2,5-dihydroxypyridine 5,6-dioxygenase